MNPLRFLPTALLLSLLLSVRGPAAPGDLDPSFGSNGKVTFSFGSGSERVYAVAVQSDGKIVLAGSATVGGELDFAVARFHPNGAPDTTFGIAGKVTTDFGTIDYGRTMAIQSDGKIVVAGEGDYSGVDIVLARYDVNGALDMSFGTGGKVINTVYSGTDRAREVLIQPDGKIVVVGYRQAGDHDPLIIRYNSNGSVDTTFGGGDGRFIFDTIPDADDFAQAGALQPDGKIVIAGFREDTEDFLFGRVTAAGAADNSFDDNGSKSHAIGGGDECYSMALQPDGKIITTGVAGGDLAVVRCLPNSDLDTTFNGTGKVLTPVGTGTAKGWGVVLQADGKIVIAGEAVIAGSLDFAVVRYKTDGGLDTTFGGAGKVTTAFASGSSDYGQAIALQSDGKILVAGHTLNGTSEDFALVRYFATVPPAAATASPASVTTMTATLAGAMNPAGTAATVYFEYGPTALYGSVTPNQSFPAGTSLVEVFSPITGLSAGSTYHYRLVATNAGGTAMGNDVSFVANSSGSGGATAVPTTTTGNAIDVDRQVATLEGTVNPNSGGTLAQFQYGFTTDYEFATPVQNIGNGTIAVPIEADLSGLTPGRTYHYRLVGTNDLGSGPGVDRTFTTPFVAPAATTEAATGVGTTTATLNGTVTPNDLTVAISFEVAESEAALLGGGATSYAALPGNLSAGLTTAQTVTASLTGLSPGPGGAPKAYFYRTRATPVGATGTSVFGGVVSFTVQNASPVAADDVFVILGDDPLRVLLNDTDADSDTLRIVSVTPPAGGTGSPQISTGLDQISYNPNDLFFDAPEGDSFTYTISDRETSGLTDTATARIFSVKVLRGLYSGLIGGEGSGADASGRLDITLSPTGQVTGSFKWLERPYPFKGATLGSDGNLTITKPKIGSDGALVAGAQLELTLTLDPITRVLTGTLTDTEADPDTVVQAELTGTATTDDVTTLPEAGTFNAVIDTGTSAALAEGASEGATLLPRGVGFAQVTVARSGKRRPARFVGRMPDNQPFSSGSRALVRALRATAGARYPLYVDNLYPRTRNQDNRLQSGGFVSGNVSFTKETDRMDSGMNWERRANVGTRFPGGFRTGQAAFTATMNAVRYGRPAPGNLPAGIVNDDRLVNAKIELREGDLANTITRTLKLTRAGTAPVRSRVEPVLGLAGNVEALKLSINANGGKFSGSFTHPADAALSKPPRTKFNGVFQGQDGQGTFTGPTNTGRIQILAQ